MSWIENVKGARDRGLFDDAMAALNKELSVRPNDPQVHYQIAWTNDALGKESDAAPAYEKAIELGLQGDDLRSAYLGLGSTYRSLGQYNKSGEIFEKGIKLFPDYRALQTFYSLTLYNLGEFEKATSMLVRQLAETSGDESIQHYKRALEFYSTKLNEVFD